MAQPVWAVVSHSNAQLITMQVSYVLLDGASANCHDRHMRYRPYCEEVGVTATRHRLSRGRGRRCCTDLRSQTVLGQSVGWLFLMQHLPRSLPMRSRERGVLVPY